MMDCSSTNLKTKEALGNVLLQHPEPLRFTQGRWTQGVSLQKIAQHYTPNQNQSKILFSGDTLSTSYIMYKSTVALALLVIEIAILIYYPKGQIISE